MQMKKTILTLITTALCLASNAQTLPEAETELAKINIVGEQGIEVDQYIRESYVTTTYTIEAPQLAALLDVADTLIEQNITSMVYAKYIDPELGQLTSTLSNNYNANPNPGFWYNQMFEEDGETVQNELIPSTFGDGSRIFLAGIRYTAETQTVTVQVGQNPGTMTDGENYTAKFYIVCGDKAYIFNVSITTHTAPVYDFNTMICVGDTMFEYETVPNSNYAYKAFTVPMHEIAELLGCEIDAIEFKAKESENTLSMRSTANNGGFWLTKAEGFISTFGEGCGVYFEPFSLPNVGDGYYTMNVGQYPGAFTADDTNIYYYSVYYTYEDKYYTYTVKFSIRQKSDNIETGDENMVAREYYEVQLNPGTPASDGTRAYHFATGTTSWGWVETDVNLDHIEELLGTRKPTFFARSKDNVEGSTVISLTSEYTNNYTNSYYGYDHYGFWMDPSGSYAASAKLADSAYGVTWNSDLGKMRWHQVSGLRQPGDFFEGIFYLVNEETGKYIEYHFEIEFQDEFPAAPTVVGEEDITIMADFNYSMQNDELTSADQSINDLDLSGAAEAFGISEDELTELSTFMAARSANSFTSANYDDLMGYAFSAYGTCVNQMSDEIMFYIYFEPIDRQLCAFAIDDIADGDSYKVRLALDYDGKRYIYNVTIVNHNDYVALTSAIQGVAVTKQTASARYNLAGQKLAAPQKGLNIVNGNKILIK